MDPGYILDMDKKAFDGAVNSEIHEAYMGMVRNFKTNKSSRSEQ